MTQPTNPHLKLDDEVARSQAGAGFFVRDGALHARFSAKNFSQGLEFVNRIGLLAEKWDHHPDIELLYSEVGIRLISHDDQAITPRDIRMSRLISECASTMGMQAQSAPPTR